MTTIASLPLGATYLGNDQCRFLVWAPKARAVEVHLVSPKSKRVPLQPVSQGYFHAVVEGASPGSRYFYRLDDARERPDPASRYQPEGVHGPSEVIDPEFPWTDAHWRGLPLGDYILYELHVGTFTPEGTFDAVIAHLDDLVDLGVTVVELMPIGQFPGARNWGYDGTFCFAAQNSYGGPDGLRRLVDACHAHGLGVALDVVYNHIGPEGNYLAAFGHYFTERYRTPWGPAINFDDRHSDEVRRYFIENALDWVTEFHIDSLRLDAVHAIFDESARPFLRELGDAIHQRAERLNRRITVIAESNKNDARHTDVREIGGYGLDAQWNDDFHHCLHVLLTSETSGYYADFGGVDRMAKAVREGFVYDGLFSPFRGRRHGVSARHQAGERFVICSQNHDQVGNRALGDRMGALASYESLKLAAGIVLLAPCVPLLFMGEEYGEKAPFLYFVDHSDEALIAAVRQGRAEEFASFAWAGQVSDPQAEDTFRRSRLNRGLLAESRHKALFDFYRELIRLRKTVPALAAPNRRQTDALSFEAEKTIIMLRRHDDSQIAAVFHFGDGVRWNAEVPVGTWRVVLDSADQKWHGPGGKVDSRIVSAGTVAMELAAKQLVVLEREED